MYSPQVSMDVFAGFRMTCLKEEVLREPAIQVVDSHAIISSTDTIKVPSHTSTHHLSFMHSCLAEV